MSVIEPTNVGLSERCHSRLKQLKEDEHFLEMRDAYRFGIALALSKGITPPEVPSPKSTIFGVATLDPDKAIYTAINSLMDLNGIPVYSMAERLAEWGVNFLFEKGQVGQIDITNLIETAKQESNLAKD